ncbi:MAG: hypothetical protein N2C14_08320, partial [Planctomycetales bacterium]
MNDRKPPIRSNSPQDPNQPPVQPPNKNLALPVVLAGVCGAVLVVLGGAAVFLASSGPARPSETEITADPDPTRRMIKEYLTRNSPDEQILEFIGWGSPRHADFGSRILVRFRARNEAGMETEREHAVYLRNGAVLFAVSMEKLRDQETAAAIARILRYVEAERIEGPIDPADEQFAADVDSWSRRQATGRDEADPKPTEAVALKSRPRTSANQQPEANPPNVVVAAKTPPVNPRPSSRPESPDSSGPSRVASLPDNSRPSAADRPDPIIRPPLLPARPLRSRTFPQAGENRSLETPVAKVPVPSEAALAEAVELVKETYQEELSAAKTPREKEGLAKKLISVGVYTTEASEAAARYVVFQQALELAVQSGQWVVANEALDLMDRWYALDVLPLKADALRGSTRAAKTPSDFKAVAHAWLGLLNAAVRVNRYDLATAYAQEAKRAAAKNPNDFFREKIQKGMVEITQIAEAFETAGAAQKKLAAFPRDIAATAIWGRFLCLYKGEWDAGLPLWSKAEGDPALAADLARPADPKTQVEVAEQWWKLSETETEELPRRRLQERAVHWYRTAEPSRSSKSRWTNDAANNGLARCPSIRGGYNYPKH